MPTHQLAIIGLGGIFAAHRDAASRSGRVRFIAAADPDPEKRAAFTEATGLPAYDSHLALMADQDVRSRLDGVVVCTPPSIRLEIVTAAFASGLGVLIEKPIAHTIDEAQRLVDLSRQHPGVPARVAYCHRYAPAIDAVRQAIAAGELGDIVRFENVFACWHPTMQQHWMSDPKLSGGGSLIDTGSHGLDLFHYLCGTSRTVGLVQRHGWEARGDCNATLLVESVAGDHPGVAGVLISGWAEPARFLVTVVGTKAMMSYDYEKPEVLQYLGADGERRTLDVASHESRFQRQLDAFADLLADPNADSALCTFEQAAEVAQSLAGTQAVTR